jgi:putative transposase
MNSTLEFFMAFNPNIHHRQSIRITNHDYSQSGAYFITVCTHQRAHMFGEIIDGRMVLNGAGLIVQNCWHKISTHFSMAFMDEWVIMPNHMHGIIVINNVGAIHESPNEKPRNIRAIHESPLQMTIIARRNMIIPKLIGRFKMQAAKQINTRRNTPGIPIWQRNYWERIIRDEHEMQSVRQYICNNPAQWPQDDLNDM